MAYAHIIAVIRDASIIAGVSYLVWRIAYAAGAFAESQRERAKAETELLSMVREFIEAQRETNKHLSVAIEVHAARLNRIEDRIGANVAGTR